MSQKKIRVLMIDDDKEEHLITSHLLCADDQVSYEFNSLYDYQSGLDELLNKSYDVCLIDYQLGGEDGLNLVRNAVNQGCQTPLILLTGHGDRSIDINAMEAGAVDYLNKGELTSQLLERVIRYAIERKKNENQLKKINMQLQQLAANDVLTGIANRNQYNHKLPLIVEQCIRNKQSIAIMFLDLDQFKQVNDTWGHSYGDLLLQQVTMRLKENLRKVDNIFRLGGDEFIIVIEGYINEEQVKKLASKIIKLLSIPFTLHEHKCQISTSIGITLANYDSMRSPEQLTKEADIAMYNAKKNGRNNYQFYQVNYEKEFLQYSHLTLDLQKALSGEQLVLYYQPLVSLNSNRTIGAEALIRWQHPTLGLIPPKVFIPIAEKIGLINAIGGWILHQACIQKKNWENMGYPNILIAVNISIHQLQQPDFVERVIEIINETHIDPTSLELEISESAITTNFHDCAKKMTDIKALGIRFVIDDFGTGYSNLGYLKHFPFDKIKIDKIFIDEISSNNNEQYIVEAIIGMAKKMGMEVLAEGVESIEQVNFLRDHHSDQVQGFYFSEPLEAKAFTRFLEKGASWN